MKNQNDPLQLPSKIQERFDSDFRFNSLESDQNSNKIWKKSKMAELSQLSIQLLEWKESIPRKSDLSNDFVQSFIWPIIPYL